MNILDIDLDFFLNSRVVYKTLSDRDDDRLIPWSETKVRNFLERKLGLSTSNPVHGSVVTNHHEVFFKWKDLIEQKQLIAPFHLTHIDAHADLGIADGSWTYILADYLKLPVSQRSNSNKGISCGNYITYAIGARWIKDIDFIICENWRDDIPTFYLTQNSKSKYEFPLKYNSYSFEIELRRINHDRIDEIIFRDKEIEEVSESIGEPVVPFKITKIEDLDNDKCNVQWDFIFLALSPGYTPTKSDDLVPIIKEYINEETLTTKD